MGSFRFPHLFSLQWRQVWIRAIALDLRNRSASPPGIPRVKGLATVQGQAMACGLPVIATTNTGGEDLFTDGVEGFVVPIRSPEAIREKVLYLYEHPEVREEMSRAALQRVQQLGGWNDYGERMVATYEQALARRGKPSGTTS